MVEVQDETAAAYRRFQKVDARRGVARAAATFGPEGILIRQLYEFEAVALRLQQQVPDNEAVATWLLSLHDQADPFDAGFLEDHNNAAIASIDLALAHSPAQVRAEILHAVGTAHRVYMQIFVRNPAQAHAIAEVMVSLYDAASVMIDIEVPPRLPIDRPKIVIDDPEWVARQARAQVGYSGAVSGYGTSDMRYTAAP